jgi:hypothetical protein
VFLVVRNTATCGTASLVDDTASAIRAALPADWQFEADVSGDAGALFRVGAPDGITATVLVEAKVSLEPHDVPRVAERIERMAAGRADAAMVLTPFVSPTMRDRLAAFDIGWFDHTLKSLRESEIPYAVTGSLAQRNYLPSGVVPVPLGIVTAPEYVAARSVLLDALTAFESILTRLCLWARRPSICTPVQVTT